MNIQLSRFKYIFSEAFWYTFANATVQLCGLIGVLFVARYLGPTNLGLYSFVQNYIAGFITILSGADIYAHWRIVQSKDVYKELLVYTYQKIILVAIVLCVGFFIAYLSLPRDIFSLTLYLSLPIFISIFSGFIFVVQYQKKAKLISITMVCSSIILLICKIGAVMFGLSLSAFILINSLDGFILTTVCVYYLYLVVKSEKIQVKDIRLQSVDFIRLGKNSVYPLVYIVLWFTVLRADQFLVPVFFNAYTLGMYSSAVKVVEMANVFIIILQAIILPRIMHINDPTKSATKMQITVFTYTMFGFVVACVISFAAPFIIQILFGQQFKEAADILRVYVWSVPGLFVSYLFALTLMSQKNYIKLAVHAILMATINIIALLFVVRYFGIIGVAWVSVGVYTLSAILYYNIWIRPTK